MNLRLFSRDLRHVDGVVIRAAVLDVFWSRGGCLRRQRELED